jgi:hypothetical protein
MVGVPVHDPVEAVSVWPAVAVPITAGTVVFAGGAAAMTDVIGDVALALPVAFVAFTTASNVPPTYPDVIANDEAVAPLMFEQLPPELLQLCHW